MKRHLTAARDTLSQLTQLPAAAQLTGDARTQVSQLISNFNELITTNADWRAAYTKLQGNLTALVGEPARGRVTGPGCRSGCHAGRRRHLGHDRDRPGHPREARRVPCAPDGIREGGGGQRHTGGKRQRFAGGQGFVGPGCGAECGGERHRHSGAECLEHGDNREQHHRLTGEQHDRVAGAGGNDRQHRRDPGDGGHFGYGHADAGSLRTGQQAVRRRAVMRRRPPTAIARR